MKLLVKNVDYFEWEVPDELVGLMNEKNLSYQDLIDEYFNLNDVAVAEGADPYYEFEEEL